MSVSFKLDICKLGGFSIQNENKKITCPRSSLVMKGGRMHQVFDVYTRNWPRIDYQPLEFNFEFYF